MTSAESCTWKQQQGGRSWEGNQQNESFLCYAFISLLMANPLIFIMRYSKIRTRADFALTDTEKPKSCRDSHLHPQMYCSTQTHTTTTQTWKMIQRVFLIRASLLYSAAQCCFSQTLIALTGGIPDGLLHCLHAAAHSSKDKSLSAVHHRLRWKNWLKIPQCTSQCNLQQETTFKHVCDHCNLDLLIPSSFYSALYFYSALSSNFH